MSGDLRICAADEVPFGAVRQLLAPGRCHGRACLCQKFRIPTRHWAGVSDQTKAQMLAEQAAAGQGAVALAGDEAIGWASVAPRPALHTLMTRALLWSGRPDEPREDPGVWAIPCFFIRPSHRRQGVTRLLLAKAVAIARDKGAHSVEGYPQIAPPGQSVPWGEMHVGSPATFATAGFHEVSRPSKRRLVMRLTF